MTGSRTVLSRLAELGVTLPPVTKPVASYVPAVRTGNLVFSSGQLPMVDGTLTATGKVGEIGAAGAGVSPDDATACARICALNALAAIHALVGLDSVVRVVKVVVFVAAVPEFTGMPAVGNGASNFLTEVFGAPGEHARSAVGVAVLPLDAPVEVELIVEVTPSD
jgi:enamine deaminase RidA (YjgF/YER057c/UK114 family)